MIEPPASIKTPAPESTVKFLVVNSMSSVPVDVTVITAGLWTVTLPPATTVDETVQLEEIIVSTFGAV